MRGDRTLGIDAATRARIRALLASDDASERALAAEAIAFMGDARGLWRALRSETDGYVRAVAVGGLARRSGGWATRAIAGAFLDRDEGVRSAVARALGRRSGRRALRTLVRMVRDDPSVSVRYHAAVSLAHLDGRAADEALAEVARSEPESRVRDAAAVLLAKRRTTAASRRRRRLQGGGDPSPAA